MAAFGTAQIARSLTGQIAANVHFAALLAANEPVILKGLVSDWPLVREGQKSSQAAMEYLRQFDSGKPVVRFAGPPDINGRFFYDTEMSGLNFASERVSFDAFLEEVTTTLGATPAPSYYIGSTDIDVHFPGLDEANRLPLDEPMFAAHPPLPSIWIGNRTTASAHYDMSNNIACCVVGRRRFTLFPPDQIANLYPGPLEPTPGGQVVSMVDFTAPDLERHPRFARAIAAAQVADLEPGDVLFYPALWWHHVEALEPFNVLINYWWNTSPAFIDSPQNTLLHGLLSLRDRPPAEKESWRALFAYYVFGDPETPRQHLPEHVRGALAPMNEMSSRRLRSMLMNRLNR
jgi:Cupin-like domain